VAERTAVGLEAVVEFGAAEAHLEDGRGPAGPQELRRLVAREVPGARLPGLRQEHVDELAVEPELAVVGDCRLEILQLAPGSAPTAARLCVGEAVGAIDLGEGLDAPPVIEAGHAAAKPLVALELGRTIINVDCEDVGDRHLVYCDAPPAVGAELFGEVVAEEPVGARSLAFRAACRDLTLSSVDAIEDVPARRSDGAVAAPAGPLELEPGSFELVRHSCLISSIALSVTMSRRPMRSITRRPRAASARSVEGEIRLRKISSQASPSVSSASGSAPHRRNGRP
jgi:hypothetical protein